MKKEKLLAKAMITLFIDEEQKKLCDRLHEVELSHNRKRKLLKQTYDLLKKLHTNDTIFDDAYIRKIENKIYNEITYPYLRQNWGYYHKQIPGHYCEE